MEESLYFLEEDLIYDLINQTAPTKEQILTLIECRLAYWPGCYLQVEGHTVGIFDDLYQRVKSDPEKAAFLLVLALETICCKRWENLAQFECGLYLLKLLAKASATHLLPERAGGMVLKLKEIFQRLLVDPSRANTAEELLSTILNWYRIK
jgi:hypothetical protein